MKNGIASSVNCSRGLVELERERGERVAGRRQRIVSSDDSPSATRSACRATMKTNSSDEQRRGRHVAHLAERDVALLRSFSASRLVGKRSSRLLAAPRCAEKPGRSAATRSAKPSGRTMRGIHCCDRQVLACDADVVHLRDVDASRRSSTISANRRCRARAPTMPTTRAARGPQRLDERVDADVRADPHAVGHAEEDQPGEQVRRRARAPRRSCS